MTRLTCERLLRWIMRDRDSETGWARKLAQYGEPNLVGHWGHKSVYADTPNGIVPVTSIRNDPELGVILGTD